MLANDQDTDSTLTAVLASAPSNGTLTLDANGSFSYTPHAGFAGVDSFTYQASDGAALSAAAKVSITVKAAAFGFVNVQNAPPPSGATFKAGSTIPMKWAFKSGSTLVDSARVEHRVTVVGPVPGGPVRTFTNTDPGSSFFRYSASSKTWTFNLQTKDAGGTPYPVGTYQVTIAPLTLGYPGFDVHRSD